MKFTQILTDLRKHIQLNAGIIVDSFDPATQTIGNILGTTNGGMNFTATPNFVDFFGDVDNAPDNTKEGKVLTRWDAVMSGTFNSLTKQAAKMLLAASDFADVDESKFVPRNDLFDSDFTELWWIGDYSDKNNGDNAGFMAIHLLNALSTGGFSIQSGDEAKGTFDFNFTGHYTTDDISLAPFELFIADGGEASVTLNKSKATVAVGETITLKASPVPNDKTVTFTSDDADKATVTSNGVVEGVAAGTVTITASITVNDTVYTDTCTVIVTAGV